MRMFASCIYFQLGHLPTAERIAGNHAFNGFFDNSFRETSGQKFSRGCFFNAADITGMLKIFFLSQLVAGQFDFVCIDNDDIVAAVQIRNKAGFVLAAQDLGNFGGKPAENNAFSINDIPFLSISDGLVAYVFIVTHFLINKVDSKFGVNIPEIK